MAVSFPSPQAVIPCSNIRFEYEAKRIALAHASLSQTPSSRSPDFLPSPQSPDGSSHPGGCSKVSPVGLKFMLGGGPPGPGKKPSPPSSEPSPGTAWISEIWGSHSIIEPESCLIHSRWSQSKSPHPLPSHEEASPSAS